MGNTVFKIKGLEKSFGKLKVLDINNYEMKRNEKVVINGENGCGKSTLVKIISGVLTPDKGQIEGFEDDVALVLSGAKGFYGYLTAYNNIKYYLGLNNIKIKDVEKKLNELSNTLNFGTFLNVDFDKLSLGNKQKCAIIAGLLLCRSLLILDEPTLGLDIESSKEVGKLISGYEGSVIVITHDLELISQLDLDVYAMLNGKFTDKYSSSDFIDLKKSQVKYYFKIKEDIGDISRFKDGEFYVITDKNICNKIFEEYTVLEFKVVT